MIDLTPYFMACGCVVMLDDIIDLHKKLSQELTTKIMFGNIF